MGNDKDNNTNFAKDENTSTFAQVTVRITPPTTIEEVAAEIDAKFGSVGGYVKGEEPDQYFLAVNFKDTYSMRHFIALTLGLDEDEKDPSVIGAYLARAGEYLFYTSEDNKPDSAETE